MRTNAPISRDTTPVTDGSHFPAFFQLEFMGWRALHFEFNMYTIWDRLEQRIGSGLLEKTSPRSIEKGNKEHSDCFNNIDARRYQNPPGVS